jgi:hypothetical protein
MRRGAATEVVLLGQGVKVGVPLAEEARVAVCVIVTTEPDCKNESEPPAQPAKAHTARCTLQLRDVEAVPHVDEVLSFCSAPNFPGTTRASRFAALATEF